MSACRPPRRATSIGRRSGEVKIDPRIDHLPLAVCCQMPDFFVLRIGVIPAFWQQQNVVGRRVFQHVDLEDADIVKYEAHWAVGRIFELNHGCVPISHEALAEFLKPHRCER